MPSEKKSRNRTRKTQENPTQKQLDVVASVPIPALTTSSRPYSPSKRCAVVNVEDIKSRALRTEELTQRAHRFTYQLAIDLREKLQAEFDALEKFSADPKSTERDLKMALIALSNKMTSEIDKQMDVQTKIAEAYEAMYVEVTNMAKLVVAELDTARITVVETSDSTRLLSDVMNVIRETVDYWVSRPEVSHRKLFDLRRDTPRESMRLDEMYERLETQVKHCHKALEHPLGGAVSISKEFAKLNILRKT